MVGMLYGDVKTLFRMSHFALNRGSEGGQVFPQNVKNECGSSGCVVGHGPLHCKTQGGDAWGVYMVKAFGIAGSGVHGPYNFLFDLKWPDRKRQAAARLYRFLTNGVPTYYKYGTSTYRVPTLAQLRDMSRELKVPLESIKNVKLP